MTLATSGRIVLLSSSMIGALAGTGVGAGQEGKYEIDLTSLSPYIGWSAGELDLWMTAGYGTGDLSITPDEQSDTISSDINMTTVGAGVSGVLAKVGKTTLRANGEAVRNKINVEGNAEISALEMNTSRIRIVLEASKSSTLASGARFEPSTEVGVRHDGGDGNIGAAGEFGMNLRYIGTTRLTIEGGARIVFGRDDYDEWGVYGVVRRDPGADGQGLSFSVSPGYGDTSSGVQKMWTHRMENELVDNTINAQDYAMRMDMRLGYGLSLTSGRGLITPYSEMTLNDNRSYRLGIIWELDSNFNLNLIGERNERTTVENSILIESKLKF